MHRVHLLNISIWRRYRPASVPEIGRWIATDREAWFVSHVLLRDMIWMSAVLAVVARLALSERGDIGMSEVVWWPVRWIEISGHWSRQGLVSVGHGEWVAVRGHSNQQNVILKFI